MPGARRNAAYSGSLERLSWADTAPEKGVIELDLALPQDDMAVAGDVIDVDRLCLDLEEVRHRRMGDDRDVFGLGLGLREQRPGEQQGGKANADAEVLISLHRSPPS